MLSQTSLEQCRSFHHNNNIQAVLWHHIFHPKEKTKDVHCMVTNVPLIMKFYNKINTRLQITANIITNEGILMGSESCAKLSTNCSMELRNIFCKINSIHFKLIPSEQASVTGGNSCAMSID